LDGKRKHNNEEVNFEDGELLPKKVKVVTTRPLGSKPSVEILAGPSRIAGSQLSAETNELLQELVNGIRDLSKVTQGLAGLSVHMHKQNIELIWIGQWQVDLVEQATKEGLGLGLGSEMEVEETENEGACFGTRWTELKTVVLNTIVEFNQRIKFTSLSTSFETILMENPIKKLYSGEQQ
jgi:hypothetical protein